MTRKENIFSKGFSFIGAGLILFSTTVSAFDDPGLSNFLDTVKKENRYYKSYQSGVEVFEKRSMEGTLLLTPYVIAQLQTSDSKQPPGISGTETQAHSLLLGVTKLSSFGLQSKVLYSFGHVDIEGANPLLVNPSKYWDLKPSLELTQPLWKNGFGRDTRAAQKQYETGHLLSSYGEKVKADQVLIEAEAAYWRLAAAQAIVKLQLESLERSKRLKDWSARRATLNLADQADLYQAIAGYEFRNVEVESARDELSQAIRMYNFYIDQAADKSVPNLSFPETESLLAMNVPKLEVPSRNDLEVQRLQVQMTDSLAIQGVEKNTPTLDAFVNGSLEGKDVAFGDSVKQSFSSDYFSYALGLKFSVPLDFATPANNRASYRQDRINAEALVDKKTQDIRQEFDFLSKRFKNVKAKLEASVKMEQAQNMRLTAERDRLSRGRSVTANVVTAEQDFANAQLSTLRIEAELLGLHTQTKQYFERR